MLRLTQRAEVWRVAANPAGGKKLQKVRATPCLILPISSFDQLPEYARESTHIAFIPRTVLLDKEDELRTSRQVRADGTTGAVKLVVSGMRSYRFGLRHTEVFCKERE